MSRPARGGFLRTALLPLFVLALALVAVPALQAAPPSQAGLHSPDDRIDGGPVTTESSASHLLQEGLLVDTAGAMAYVMNPAGGIDAIGLADGALVWRSELAEKPLALADGLLIAQGPAAASLELVGLEARESGAVRGTARVELPEGLGAQVEDGPWSRFAASVRPEGSDLLVTWQATTLPRQGYLPGDVEGLTPQAAARTAQVERGAARVDLATGRSTRVENLRAERSNIDTALQLGPRTAALPGRQFLSADGRHSLRSERAGAEAGHLTYRWTLYDRATGEALGSVERRQAAAPFLVVGTTLVHVGEPTLVERDGSWVDQPLALRAVDLGTGNEVWTREVRDLRFEGPFPP